MVQEPYALKVVCAFRSFIADPWLPGRVRVFSRAGSKGRTCVLFSFWLFFQPQAQVCELLHPGLRPFPRGPRWVTSRLIRQRSALAQVSSAGNRWSLVGVTAIIYFQSQVGSSFLASPSFSPKAEQKDQGKTLSPCGWQVSLIQKNLFLPSRVSHYAINIKKSQNKTKGKKQTYLYLKKKKKENNKQPTAH